MIPVRTAAALAALAALALTGCASAAPRHHAAAKPASSAPAPPAPAPVTPGTKACSAFGAVSSVLTSDLQAGPSGLTKPVRKTLTADASVLDHWSGVLTRDGSADLSLTDDLGSAGLKVLIISSEPQRDWPPGELQAATQAVGAVESDCS